MKSTLGALPWAAFLAVLAWISSVGSADRHAASGWVDGIRTGAMAVIGGSVAAAGTVRQ